MWPRTHTHIHTVRDNYKYLLCITYVLSKAFWEQRFSLNGTLGRVLILLPAEFTVPIVCEILTSEQRRLCSCKHQYAALW